LTLEGMEESFDTTKMLVEETKEENEDEDAADF
jgi:hypothetical protein